MGGGEKTGPRDELEALRADLLAKIRRQPADTRTLTRGAEALTRMRASERRLSLARGEELRKNISNVMDYFDDIRILPPDEVWEKYGGAPRQRPPGRGGGD